MLKIDSDHHHGHGVIGSILDAKKSLMPKLKSLFSGHRIYLVIPVIACLLFVVIIVVFHGYSNHKSSAVSSKNTKYASDRLDGTIMGQGNGGNTAAGSSSSSSANSSSGLSSQAGGTSGVQLLSYPPPYINSATNSLAPGLVASSENQFTSLVADQSQVKGVVLKLYWSEIEPSQGSYNWSIIDQALQYWQARDKKVVIDIAPYGEPADLGSLASGGIQDGLPQWLVNLGAQTLPPYNDIVVGSTNQTAPISVPVPFNSIYQSQYQSLIQQLGRRYNGNPGVAYVRIGLGKMGEEVYPIYCSDSGKGQNIPTDVCNAATADGWTPAQWYSSSISVAQAYRAAFPNTSLSLDLGLAGYFYNPGFSYNGQQQYQYQPEAQKLITFCESNNIMLGDDGLNDNSLASIVTGQADNNSVVFQMLYNISQTGHPIELETVGPLYNSQMTNPPAIYQAIQLLKPKYVNFFGDLYGINDYQNGVITPSTQASWNQFTSLKISQSLSSQQVQARASAWQNVLSMLKS